MVACVFLPLPRQEQRGRSIAGLKYTQDGSKKSAMVHRQPPHVLGVQAKRKSGYRKGMGRKRVDLKAQLLETARASDLQLRALQKDRSSWRLCGKMHQTAGSGAHALRFLHCFPPPRPQHTRVMVHAGYLLRRACSKTTTPSSTSPSVSSSH